MSVLLAATAGLLFAVGTYLVLQRTLTRIIIGIGLLSHGANVLWVTSGRRGLPAMIGSGSPEDFSDPLPQALTLTAIVITFGVTTFLLALAYRSWVLTHDDEVEHDLDDLALRRAEVEVADQLDVATRPDPGRADIASDPDPPTEVD